MSDTQMKSNNGPNRRKFLQATAAGIFAAQFSSVQLMGATQQPKPKAIAFDAFAIFDPRPVFELARKLFPAHGAELSSEWRRRQFEYTWLRTVAGNYADFWQVTGDALTYAANKIKVNVSDEDRSRLMNAYLQLNPWPDVVPVLTALKNANIRMALLSNFTATMLGSCVETSGLKRHFEYLLSTDEVKAFKPSPLAYQMGLNAFQLSHKEILFVAFAGWDAAGARIFGYPTFWANRLNVPAEELGIIADRSAVDLKYLLSFLGS